MLLVTLHLVVTSRIGAFALSLALVVFTIWMSVRAVEMAATKLWVWSGALAQSLRRKVRLADAIAEAKE